MKRKNIHNLFFFFLIFVRWFFAFSSIDKDQLIAAYVELIEKFDLAVLLPTESDVTLFVQVLTNYAEEMNALLVSTIKKVFL